MSEVLELHDGVRFFADGRHGGNNAQELKRLRDAIKKDTGDFERNVSSLPETESEVLDRILSSKKSLLALLENPDKVWESVPLSEFRNNGKYNCLSIDPAGNVFLDIIKPGVHERYTVELAGHISAEGIQTLRAALKEKAPTWEDVLPPGFLAEGETEHNEENTFDKNGGARPGAIFVADRVLDLGVINDARRAVLHWIVRHKNGKGEGDAVTVDDKFAFEWESLPQH